MQAKPTYDTLLMGSHPRKTLIGIWSCSKGSTNGLKDRNWECGNRAAVSFLSSPVIGNSQLTVVNYMAHGRTTQMKKTEQCVVFIAPFVASSAESGSQHLLEDDV